MHYKVKISREQFMVLSYDTMIAPDNAVRLIDLMCKKFFKEQRADIERKGSKKEGCKSYPPSSMLALLVYGYFNGIASSRKLERETYRNIEVLWLMEGFQPDHWTICEFRRNSETMMKEFLKSFRRFLIEGTYANAEKIVFDGTKVKAYARREMLTVESIKEKLSDIDKSISDYLSKIERSDNHDNEMDFAKAEIAKLKAKIQKLENAKSKLVIIEKAIEESGEKYYAPNDSDARLVKGRDGKFAGFNVQVGVDTKGHYIMADRVTNDSNDMQQLRECVKSVEEQTGIKPKEVSADKGYSNTTQILEIEKDGQTQCYVPLIGTKREELEKGGISFNYDKETDTYICSQGKQLKLFTKNAKDREAYYDIYKCFDCEKCSIRNQCSTSKTGRIVKRNTNQDKIEQYKEKIMGEYAKKKINERKCVVEHTFGTIKYLMGKFNFLLKGKNKAQIEFDYYTTAYNLKRLINSSPITNLTIKMNNFNWAVA